MTTTKYFSLMRSTVSFSRKSRAWLYAGVLAIAGMTSLSSCSEYDLDEETPDNWGSSIYSYLAEHGQYRNMVSIINDISSTPGELDYKTILSKTGSKTLFVANDDAFDRFFKNNSWGVSSYKDLSLAQKKMLLFGSMINNSFQLNYLCNTEGNVKGVAMRRLSGLSVYDSIPRLTPDQLPENIYWQHLKDQPFVYCFKDLTRIPMIYFMQSFLDNNKITDDD